MAIIAVWSALALLFVPQGLLSNLQRAEPLPMPVVLYTGVTIFVIWMLFTPLVLRLAMRWPIERTSLPGSLLRHFLAAGGLSMAHVLLMTALHLPWTNDASPLPLLSGFMLGLGATNILLYAAVVVAGHALSYLDRWRAGERARANAELSVLRAQLNPHFLFNTLNALSELVHHDAALAERLILRLSALFRRTLAKGGANDVSLAEELEFCAAYLEIQHALMGDRLKVTVDAGEHLMPARVPIMLLQPLLENAISHGLSARRAGGNIGVAVAELGAKLQLTVVDDGVGAAESVREGIGLGNTRASLAALYGENATLNFRNLSPGFEVVVTLPLRLEQSSLHK